MEGAAGKYGSFLLNGRVAWPTLLGRLISSGEYNRGQNGSSSSFSLFDFLGKYVYQKRPDTKWTFSVFSSGDAGFAQDDLDNGLFLDEFAWLNTAAAIQWRHTPGKNSVWDAAVYASRYTYQFEETHNLDSYEGVHTNYSESDVTLQDLSANMNYSYSLSNQIDLRTGGQTIRHHFDTYILERYSSPKEDTLATRNLGQVAWENSAYMEASFRTPSEVLLFTGGLRWSSLYNDSRFFQRWEPRARASLRILHSLSLHAGYDRHTQYLHQIVSDIAIFPNDIWLVATAQNPPEQSSQIYAGLGGEIGKKHPLAWTVEFFTKDFNGLARVLPGSESSLTLTNSIDDIIARDGRGKSQGLELFLERQGQKLQWSLAYTLSYSERSYPQINSGAWFPFTFDRRHDIGAQLVWQANDKWMFSSNFVYQTGHAFTAPITTSFLFNIYDDYNNARMPAFHRLNLGATRSWIPRRKPQQARQLAFSVYNAYNRANPYTVEVNPATIYEDPGNPNSNSYYTLKTYTRSLLPLVPGLSYKVIFN
ncbi:MAG: hypothetical protein R2795_23840 [Saprospiraceae bacterium]